MLCLVIRNKWLAQTLGINSDRMALVLGEISERKKNYESMSKLGSPCLPSLEFTDWFRIHRMYCYREIAILLRKRMIALLRVKKASETDSDKLRL